MDYPRGAGIAVDYFGAGKPGFQDGNAGTGVEGTELTGAFFNDLLGNVMNVLAVGGVPPTPARAADLSDAIVAIAAKAVQGIGQCQLQYSSNVALALVPKNGNSIRVNGKTYGIPAGGIAIANAGVRVSGVAASNLAAATDYLLYVVDDGAGNLVPDFWPLADGHITDTTAGNVGVEVRRTNLGAIDTTRTLIGMVGTDAGSHFSDTDAARLVLSWFNRRQRRSRSFFSTGTVSTSSASAVELHTSIRNTFMMWSGDEIEFQINGTVSSNTTGGSPQTMIGFDGVVPEIESGSFNEPSGSALSGNVAFSGRKVGLAEGRHYATLLGLNTTATGGTSQYNGGNTAPGVTGNAPTEITLTIGG